MGHPPRLSVSAAPLPLLALALAVACKPADSPQSLHYDGDHLEVWAVIYSSIVLPDHVA